jgi:hypothetical protein
MSHLSQPITRDFLESVVRLHVQTHTGRQAERIAGALGCDLARRLRPQKLFRWNKQPGFQLAPVEAEWMEVVAVKEKIPPSALAWLTARESYETMLRPLREAWTSTMRQSPLPRPGPGTCIGEPDRIGDLRQAIVGGEGRQELVNEVASQVIRRLRSPLPGSLDQTSTDGGLVFVACSFPPARTSTPGAISLRGRIRARDNSRPEADALGNRRDNLRSQLSRSRPPGLCG